MQPIIIMPMNDPDGIMFPHLEIIAPQLKTIFAQAIVGIPSETSAAQPEYVARLENDDFIQVNDQKNANPVGDFFLGLYEYAAASSHPEQLLHLCFPDRIAFTLQSKHRPAFIADIRSVTAEQTPLIFQRSAAAWETHPQNYRDIEGMITKASEWLFGKPLDFAWCHLVVQARRLQMVLPYIKNRDLSMLAEIALWLKDDVQTKDVDWLAWEDPFITGCRSGQLKLEREGSLAETRKRLSYVIPMLQLMYDYA